VERDTGLVRPTFVKRSLLLVPVVLAALLVLPATSAWACSCAQMTTAQATEAADVVLRGTLTETYGPSKVGLLRSSEDPVRYTFNVAEIFKDDAAATTYVHSAASGASCGIEGLLPGREYVLFAQAKGEQLWVGLCGGSELAASGFVADVEQVTGPGQPPVPQGLIDEAAPLPGQRDVTGDRAWLVPLVGGAVLALVLAGLLVGVVRRGRRRG
jgi:hypothetical protein